MQVIKSHHKEGNDFFIMRNKHLGFWCPSNTKIQGIRNQHSIVLPEYSGLSTRKVNTAEWCYKHFEGQ